MAGHVFEILKETVTAWLADKAPRLAAAIAYSTVFAIAPLLIITIAIVGAVLGFGGSAHPHTAVENVLIQPIAHAAGNDAAQLVRGMVDASFGKPRESTIAQIVGWITFVIGASGVFAALQDALNTVWDVKPPEHQNLLVMIRDRAATVGMLLVIGFVLVMSLFLNVAIAFVSANLTHVLPFANAGLAFAAINWLVSIIVIAVLFGLIFKVLPDCDIRWRDVGIGALVTAVLFVLGQALIGIYIGKAGVASAYGAAGALLAILVWIYYSALILLFGAEFTKIQARRSGTVPDGPSLRPIEPLEPLPGGERVA
jgi:membrane protein